MKAIQHGTLVRRTINDSQYGFVGLIYPSSNEGITEGSGYLMEVSESGSTLWSRPVDDPPDGYSSNNIDGLLTQPIWAATRSPGFSMVRKMPMGRGSKGLVVFGANTLPFVESQSDKLDTLIHIGRKSLDSEPISQDITRGETFSQILGNSGLFTCPRGNPLYLPSIPSRMREASLRLTDYRLSRIRGEISDDDFVRKIERDALCRDLCFRPQGDSPEFLEYLRRMDDMGALPDHHDFKTEQEHRQYKRAIKEVMASMMPDEHSPSISP